MQSTEAVEPPVLAPWKPRMLTYSVVTPRTSGRQRCAPMSLLTATRETFAKVKFCHWFRTVRFYETHSLRGEWRLGWGGGRISVKSVRFQTRQQAKLSFQTLPSSILQLAEQNISSKSNFFLSATSNSSHTTCSESSNFQTNCSISNSKTVRFQLIPINTDARLNPKPYNFLFIYITRLLLKSPVYGPMSGGPKHGSLRRTIPMFRWNLPTPSSWVLLHAQRHIAKGSDLQRR